MVGFENLSPPGFLCKDPLASIFRNEVEKDSRAQYTNLLIFRKIIVLIMRQ